VAGGQSSERKFARSKSPGGRRDNSPGRRRYDYDPRVTFGRKTVVLMVIVGQAFYLAGDALLFGHNLCP